MSLDFPGSNADFSLGYWVRLTDQIDRLQAGVDGLLAVAESSASQVEGLLLHLTDPSAGRALDERLAGLLVSQEAGQEQWQALSDGLNDLGQTVAKLNRIQFKSNALAEVKDQQVATALGVLQDVAARREQTQEARILLEQDRSTALRAEARGELAADLLPALDGLEMALDSGRALLARRQQEAEARRKAQEQSVTAELLPASPGLSQRLAWALWGRGLPSGLAQTQEAPPLSADREGMAEALEAWLRGLEMVRTRFLAVLATADIHPVQAEGQPFDPRLHLAMATESRAGVPDGTVVAVLRKGYRQRSRVLRYAEVAVNQAGAAKTESAAAAEVSHLPQAQREEHLQQDDAAEGSKP